MQKNILDLYSEDHKYDQFPLGDIKRYNVKNGLDLSNI